MLLPSSSLSSPQGGKIIKVELFIAFFMAHKNILHFKHLNIKTKVEIRTDRFIRVHYSIAKQSQLVVITVNEKRQKEGKRESWEGVKREAEGGRRRKPDCPCPYV